MNFITIENLNGTTDLSISSFEKTTQYSPSTILGRLSGISTIGMGCGDEATISANDLRRGIGTDEPKRPLAAAAILLFITPDQQYDNEEMWHRPKAFEPSAHRVKGL